MDQSGVVQAALAPGHECRAAIQGVVLVGESNESRIIGLVKCSSEFAIFMYSHRRMAIIADDVLLEEIVPISEDFVIEEVIQNMHVLGSDTTVKIISRDVDQVLQLPFGSQTRIFLHEIHKAHGEVLKQAVTGGFPLQFQWLSKYQQKKNSQLHRSRGKEYANNTASSFTCAGEKIASKIGGDSDLLALELDGEEKVTQKDKDDFVDPIPERHPSDIEAASEASSSTITYLPISSPEITDDSVRNSNVMVTNKGHILSMPQFGLRDNLIKSELLKQEEKYTYIRDYRIFAGTYNVNGKSPKQDLRTWLSFDNEPPDIYCVGFQEIDLSKEAFLFNDTPKEEEWFLAVTESLHPSASYAKIKLVRLVGMMLILYVRKELAAFVTEVEVETVGTGIMGRMGNKGGVSIRFQFHNTSLCIVNSHLAAHTEECDRRNQDYKEICSRMRFIQSNLPLASLTIMKHDIIIWLGDLNYRICHPEVETIKKLIAAKDYKKLVKFDQLTKHMENLQVFQGFKEGALNFQPTYKYDIGTDNWDTSEKCRVPAWCDRILWKGSSIKQLDYRSHMALRISDHKPVSSLFQVGIKVVNQDLCRKTYENIVRTLDRMENDSIPSVSLSKTEFHFENVKFMQLQVQTLVIANTGLVPCQFEFITKLNEPSYCKPWFSATPNKGILTKGERIEIELEVYVNKMTALSLNMGADRIEDILILHLRRGKDYFLAISGNYLPSCFGSSLHALCCMKEPIHDVLPERIQELERKAMENKYTDCFPNDVQLDIPKEIWTMVDHLHRNASLQGDLFQQPGLKSEFEEIRDCLDTGIPDFLPGSNHSICEALLLLLDALPEPVITYNLYDKCLESSSSLTQIDQVIYMLPQCHRKVFYYLIAFLRELLKNASFNNLDVSTLASIFGSLLLRPPPNAVNKYDTVVCKKAAQLFISRFLTQDG
ncbi:type II inositol 1,4,5-trisphosphate 5-phosphatase isoform X2 [Pristis pectinata]|uniref:type II inositol 1,4,5-trisphosphate 5-phosphatase isoform X2 n=1 Tax=Pristis pectinata TaxID=685728 RepID=UPI00223E7041|nr:type II inositol 1,4,5-trisphosphate 5-phosphatase isoform X2 [Pristis pectinata]